jgi:hypothetical protein
MKKALFIIIGIIGLSLAAFSLFGAEASLISLAIAPFGMFGNMSAQEKAEILSICRENMSFEGNGDLYDGGGDDLVCFDGNANGTFLTEASIYRQFTFTIVNTDHLATKDIYLTPGNQWNSNDLDAFKILFELCDIQMLVPADAFGVGVPVAPVTLKQGGLTPKVGKTLSARGFVYDGQFLAINEDFFAGKPTLTGSGSPYAVRDFYAFIADNPTNLMGLKIQSNGNDGAQVAFPIEVISQSPFKQLESKPINPSTNLTQDSNQKDVVLFATKDIILSNQTQLKYRIAAAIDAQTPRTVNITFICGAVLNTAGALKNKQTKAVKNFAGAVQKLAIGTKK